MPGFNIGGGAATNQKSNIAEPRRKHRWVISALSSRNGAILNQDELIYLQKAARPSFKYKAVDMHHDQEEAWFAGKQSWEPMKWSFYDIEDPVDLSFGIRYWINTITESFNDPARMTTVALPADYKGQATIQYYGGGGSISEEWTLYGVWPEDSNWNDLDYTSSDIQLIEVTVRYDKAVGVKLN